MRIGVLGTGSVGHALGRGFIETGNEVRMGSRDAANEKALVWARQSGERASTGTFADAVDFGEVVVLAILGTATESIISHTGPDRFRGKVVIDATNPLDFSTFPPTLFVGHTDSLGERVQRLIPGAHVVKAFNIIGNADMFRPDFPGGPPDMFIAGNSDDTKSTVGRILHEFGFGVVDLGGIEASRYLEPMCLAWVLHGARTGTWRHAFKLLRK
jgi:predicted dinucleotide-binding enzyme